MITCSHICQCSDNTIKASCITCINSLGHVYLNAYLAEILEMIQLIFQAVTRTAANEESEVMLLSWDKCTSLSL